MPTYTYTQAFLIICSKHCFASRLGGEASLLTHLLRHQNWRATGVMKVIHVSSTTINLSILTRIAPAPTAPAKTGCIGLICPAGVIGARVCAVGVCSSGAQCQGDEDDEASEKTDWRHEIANTELNSVPEWFEQKMLKNDTKFQAQTERANFCSFQLRMSKMLKLKQIPRSSSPRTCGFKPPTDIFPTAERPDNRMKKRLMTKPRRGRTKEHGVIPANNPNVQNTNSWENK